MKKTTIATLIWLALVVFVLSACLWHYTPRAGGATIPVHIDARETKLKIFFQKYNCGGNYEKNYIQAADRYGIDWRLLPAISVQESTCGKNAYFNNLWGWRPQGHLAHFTNIEQGIDRISKSLGTSKNYSKKDIRGKLIDYGASDHSNYPNEVILLMDQMK